MLCSFCALVVAILLGGCTLVEQDAAGVGNQLQEGFQGRGRIVPNDPTADSFGSEYN
ncbi:MAG: hypothetical protein Fur0032_09440 [Terrimicrobiaceae bacterium]